jgi:Zn-dependent protease
MYFPKGSLEMGKPGKFSRVEITHILISMCVLTIAFSLLFTKNNLFFGIIHGFNLETLLLFIPVSFLSIVTAFFFHEISHKFMAQKFGLWSEFRMYPRGLFLALLLSLFVPFVFAAPGAVMFRGQTRVFETGRIAMAGPLANIVISGVTLPLYLFVFIETPIGQLIGFICLINAFLAVFNLMPFGPLDGIKIIRWNVNVWFIMLIVSACLTVFAFQKFSPVL